MNLKTKMEKLLISAYSNTAGINVYKKGKLVYEQYYNGCSASNPIHIASVTKSIISALFGIAINQGFIDNLDEKVINFFPEYTNTKGNPTIQLLTLETMLTMTAPYKCKVEPYQNFFLSDNWMQVALSILGGKGTIGEFRYAPIVGSHLLSGILTKAIGQSILEFANIHLFTPLGIQVKQNIELPTKEESNAFIKANSISGWVIDPQGINTAGWGLTLTASDMAKIGQLYLEGGMWNGQELIPSDWIKKSTTKQTECKDIKGLSYGYFWWIVDEKEHAFAAMGDGGNIIYVNEEKELVISIASLYLPNAKDRLKLIRDYMEPVFE